MKPVDRVVGVDVGGTKVAAGLVDHAGRVVRRVARPTPVRDGAALESMLIEMVGELQRLEGPVTTVGVAAAGLVDSEKSVVVYSPNIPIWRDEPVGERLAAALGIPVTLDNDANATGWAEARFGAGRGCRNLVCVTLGTGIGGAVIAEGSLVRGESGLGGEVGHMIVERNGRRCPCGSRGCWEPYASGTALATQARELADSAPNRASSLAQLADSSGLPAITGEAVLAAAQAGDPIALAAYEQCGGWLGLGLAALATVLNPGLIVISGGAAAAGELLLTPAGATMRSLMFAGAAFGAPALRLGRLGADAGLIGAADLARTNLLPQEEVLTTYRGAPADAHCLTGDPVGGRGGWEA